MRLSSAVLSRPTPEREERKRDIFFIFFQKIENDEFVRVLSAV
jgi:hypothetical protein